MEGMSVADYLAIDRGRDNGGFGFGDSGFLWVILIFLFFLAFSGNGFGFGGNNANTGALPQVDRDVLTTSCNTQKEILESRYNTQLGFHDLSSRLDSCCCQLSASIHAEGEQTRALITQNTIDDLRDRLNSARDQLGNLQQTASIISAVRPFPQPAYITCSPYANACGCGSCNVCPNGNI